MAERELHYLTNDMAQEVDQIVSKFINEDITQTPEELLTTLQDILPVDKMQRKTMLMRVEGFMIATDLLWKSLLKDGSISRSEIVTKANIKTMSHYQYVTGSRTPPEFLKTRSDFYNDPATALAKLRDDVKRLSGFMLELRTETMK